MQTGDAKRVQIGTLIFATSLVQFANGFFGTFFSLRVAVEGFDSVVAGFVLAGYFAGFTLSAAYSGRIIGRIGHIRAYAGFAGLVVAATAAMPLIVSPWPWLALRAVVGFGCAGLFIATESWLAAKAEPSARGRMFAIYMAGTFLALAAGQILIGWADVTTAVPFSIIVTLFAIALVLVSMARAEQPRTEHPEAVPLRELVRATPVAVAGCLLSGVITGAFYALVPAWMQGAGIAQGTIAWFMLVAVLGGLAFQVPVGWLSDRVDRRLILVLLGAGIAAAAAALVLLPRSFQVVLIPAVLLGGFMSTIYPVCIAHAHDRMPADRVVAVSGWLILISGVGSVLGPIVGGSAMGQVGIDGVLYLMAGAALLMAAVAIGSGLVRPPPVRLERPFAFQAPESPPIPQDVDEPPEPAAATAVPANS